MHVGLLITSLLCLSCKIRDFNGSKVNNDLQVGINFVATSDQVNGQLKEITEKRVVKATPFQASLCSISAKKSVNETNFEVTVTQRDKEIGGSHSNVLFQFELPNHFISSSGQLIDKPPKTVLNSSYLLESKFSYQNGILSVVENLAEDLESIEVSRTSQVNIKMNSDATKIETISFFQQTPKGVSFIAGHGNSFMTEAEVICNGPFTFQNLNN